MGTGAARWIATCGGLGDSPVAPGTVASLPVALVVWALAPAPVWLVAVTVLVSAVGVWASGREEARTGVHDPPSIVIDEVAGMCVALIGHPRSLPWVLGLFVLFRVLDVWKPTPIHRLQHLPGGVGIVADDLLAGLYANVLGQLRHLVS